MNELSCPHCGFTDELIDQADKRLECDHCGTQLQVSSSGEKLILAAKTAPEKQVVNSKVMIRGDKLLLQNEAILPAFCVRTGVPVDKHQMVTKSFTWCTNAIYIFFPLIPPLTLLFIIAYFLLNKKCTVTYGLSEQVQRRSDIALVYITLCFASVLGLAFYGDEIFAVVFPLQALLIFSCLMVYYLFAAKRNLQISAYENGWFIVSGLSEEFRQRLLNK